MLPIHISQLVLNSKWLEIHSDITESGLEWFCFWTIAVDCSRVSEGRCCYYVADGCCSNIINASWKHFPHVKSWRTLLSSSSSSSSSHLDAMNPVFMLCYTCIQWVTISQTDFIHILEQRHFRHSLIWIFFTLVTIKAGNCKTDRLDMILMTMLPCCWGVSKLLVVEFSNERNLLQRPVQPGPEKLSQTVQESWIKSWTEQIVQLCGT